MKSDKKSKHFLIDKLTNNIEDANTGESFVTEVLRVTREEIKQVHKKDGWNFNWRQEYKQEGREIYKLVIAGTEPAQGLVSIEPMEGYVEVHLIENAPGNFGTNKAYLGVAGNLVAFACKMSFDLGFEGYIAFTAKTALFEHYNASLGATLIFKDRMEISTEPARKLVNLYYKGHLK